MSPGFVFHLKRYWRLYACNNEQMVKRLSQSSMLGDE